MDAVTHEFLPFLTILTQYLSGGFAGSGTDVLDGFEAKHSVTRSRWLRGQEASRKLLE